MKVHVAITFLNGMGSAKYLREPVNNCELMKEELVYTSVNAHNYTIKKRNKAIILGISTQCSQPFNGTLEIKKKKDV